MKTKDIIKHLMEFHTTRELADMTGYHENTISQWRRGLNEPPYYAVSCIAQATGYEIKFIRKQDDQL
jgi:transcriptional regulator with XRE-family HTH domain